MKKYFFVKFLVKSNCNFSCEKWFHEFFALFCKYNFFLSRLYSFCFFSTQTLYDTSIWLDSKCNDCMDSTSAGIGSSGISSTLQWIKKHIKFTKIFFCLFSGSHASCYFPAAFQGEYVPQAIMSGVPTISYSTLSVLFDSIPVWGICHKRIGMYFVCLKFSYLSTK